MRAERQGATAATAINLRAQNPISGSLAAVEARKLCARCVAS